MMNARNRSVFTASQWQELDHQAQIFKYMVSGIPIPPDLIFHIKRSCRSLDSSSSISSRLFPHQPMGWGCFQVGFGRKPDPEPGRCRRTDGKKWRCSKEAFPDSKYCERHMHRGRNRSRKPVEIISSTTTTKQPIPSSLSSSSINKISNYSFSPLMASAQTHHHHHHHPHNTTTTTTLHPFLYTNSSTSRPPGIDFSHQNSNTHLVLDSGSSYSQSHKDYSENNRYFQGLKEGEEDNCDFFMNSFSPDPKKQKNYSEFQSGYSPFQLQSLTDLSKDQQKNHKEQHCFVLGTDFNSKTTMKMEKKEEPKQPLRHFFDEWPLKSRDSWLALEENRSNQAYFSNTQLSISIPMSSTDFNSRTQNDG